jgi:hypothetical protein
MTPADLTLAPDCLPSVLDGLDAGEDTARYAGYLCERYDSTDPDAPSLSQSPSAIAAGAVYLSGLLHGESWSQGDVAEAAGVAVPTIRVCYQALAVREFDVDGLDDLRADAPRFDAALNRSEARGGQFLAALGEGGDSA